MSRICLIVIPLSLATILLALGGCGPLQTRTAAPEKNGPQRAVSSLLGEAENALASGQPDRAEDYLERALRIEPRNALLWHTLAKTKYHQGLYPQTIQLGLRSNTFAAAYPGIQHRNWLLMEQAYLRLGDSRRAGQARRKALKANGRQETP